MLALSSSTPPRSVSCYATCRISVMSQDLDRIYSGSTVCRQPTGEKTDQGKSRCCHRQRQRIVGLYSKQECRQQAAQRDSCNRTKHQSKKHESDALTKYHLENGQSRSPNGNTHRNFLTS